MKNSTNKKSPSNEYVRYSGLAFQMMAVIGLSIWGGMKLDNWAGWKFPVFTISLTMAGIVGVIIFLVRSLPK